MADKTITISVKLKMRWRDALKMRLVGLKKNKDKKWYLVRIDEDGLSKMPVQKIRDDVEESIKELGLDGIIVNSRVQIEEYEY